MGPRGPTIPAPGKVKERNDSSHDPISVHEPGQLHMAVSPLEYRIAGLEQV